VAPAALLLPIPVEIAVGASEQIQLELACAGRRLVAHQVIVFPSGVARSRLDRLLIGSVYVLAVGGYVVSEIFPSTNDVLAALAIPLIAVIIFDVVERWLAATPPARRALKPILWAGPPVLIVAALAVAHDFLDVGSSSAVDWMKLVYIALQSPSSSACCGRRSSGPGSEISSSSSATSPLPDSCRTRWPERSAIRRSSLRTGFPGRTPSSTVAESP
jgi:hypothetical protein